MPRYQSGRCPNGQRPFRFRTPMPDDTTNGTSYWHCSRQPRPPFRKKTSIPNKTHPNSASHWHGSRQREAPFQKKPSIPNDSRANSDPHWHGRNHPRALLAEPTRLRVRNPSQCSHVRNNVTAYGHNRTFSSRKIVFSVRNPSQCYGEGACPAAPPRAQARPRAPCPAHRPAPMWARVRFIGSSTSSSTSARTLPSSSATSLTVRPSRSARLARWQAPS